MNDPLVLKYVQSSVSASTSRGYDSVFRKWEYFASSRRWSVVPADPENFAVFLAHEGHAGSSAGQLSAVAAAVAHRHAQAAAVSLTSHTAVKKVLMGVKRSAARPVCQRSPLSFQILREVGVVARSKGSLKFWRTFWRMSIEFYALLSW